MKKRKFPAGLLIALVVLLAGAGIYSAANTSVANRTPEENARIMAEEQMANQPKPPADATPSAPTKEQIASQVRATAGGKGAEPARRPGEPGAAPEAGTSILAPKSTPYKPVPNDSATSSQWYEKKGGR